MSGQTVHEQTSGAGKTFLSSGEVVERLGISKSTLYAYVSRGLIRSEPVPGSPRTRRYRADDVERLLNRQRIRTDPEQVTATALDWGAPLLESEVSRVSEERLYYRERDAQQLARICTFEEVVALLWLGNTAASLPAVDDARAASRGQLYRDLSTPITSLDSSSRLQLLLPILEQSEPASYDFRDATLNRIGMEILQMFTATLVGQEGRSGIARTLQAYWAPGKPEMAELLDAALILSADHELNISTFTVRCIASARSPLYSAIAGGLSALRGQKHGGATLQAESLFSEVASSSNPYQVLRRRVERGESLAGFGHRLYPSGDPRSETLLGLIRERIPESDDVRLAGEICLAADELQGLKPNLDFGLVLLGRALNQPAGVALSLMALGRIAGWVAHAREEYARDQLIRPRARAAGNAGL
jgi:citrate synthase